MTMKEMFKKVETYNEIADMMCSRKANICFSDNTFTAECFEDYNSFRKFIKREYTAEVADKILKANSWEIDGKMTIEWVDCFGTTQVINCEAELTARW